MHPITWINWGLRAQNWAWNSEIGIIYKIIAIDLKWESIDKEDDNNIKELALDGDIKICWDKIDLDQNRTSYLEKKDWYRFRPWK